VLSHGEPLWSSRRRLLSASPEGCAPRHPSPPWPTREELWQITGSCPCSHPNGCSVPREIRQAKAMSFPQSRDTGQDLLAQPWAGGTKTHPMGPSLLHGAALLGKPKTEAHFDKGWLELLGKRGRFWSNGGLNRFLNDFKPRQLSQSHLAAEALHCLPRDLSKAALRLGAFQVKFRAGRGDVCDNLGLSPMATAAQG